MAVTKTHVIGLCVPIYRLWKGQSALTWSAVSMSPWILNSLEKTEISSPVKERNLDEACLDTLETTTRCKAQLYHHHFGNAAILVSKWSSRLALAHRDVKKKWVFKTRSRLLVHQFPSTNVSSAALFLLRQLQRLRFNKFLSYFV